MSDGLLSDADLGIGGAASSGGDKLLSDADVGVAGPKYTVAGKDMGGAGKYVAAPFVGFNKGVADALGTPVDLINAGLRAVGVPVSDKPFLGSESIKRGMGLVGANPDEAPAPQNGAEKLLRAAGTGVGQAVGLEMAGAPIARGIAGLAPRTAETIEALTGGGKSVAGTGINATIGAGGSMGSEAAQEAMPESWRTAAGLAGGLAGGFGAAGVAMAPRAVGAGVAAAKKYMMPKTNPEQYAADTLAGFLSDPAAVRAALDLGSGELVPGSKPTLGQLTGDMGALSAEREAATRHPEDFAVRRGEQNAARLDSLEGLQRDGNPADVSNLLRRRMTEFDALAAAHENATATQAQGATNAALGAPRTPEDMGASIRDAVAAGRAQAKDEERALRRAVDPDGTLALPVGPLKSAADRIQSNVSSLARPMEGEERAIFSDVGNAPEVVPFSDLTALRSRVSTAMREELRSAGQTPTYARLSQLRGSIEDAISSAAENIAAHQQEAVSRGTMAPEDALVQRLQQWVEQHYAQRDGLAEGRASSVTGEASGTAGGPSHVGTESEGGTGFGGASHPPGVSGEALSPEWDAGTLQRLRTASDATKERARTFDQGPVGDVLRTRGAANDFRLPDSAVVSKAFTPGPRGFETAQAFRKAAGDDESATRAMADYAAYLVRKNAVDPATGLINPGRLANFQRQYADALRAFPDVARRFSSASSAGEAVAEVMAQRRAALDAYQSGTIGKLLGVTEPSEVTAKIGQIFGQSDAMAQMKRLASEARHDPNAMDGLRKSIADFIRGRFMSNTEVGASGLTGLKSDQFQTFVRKNAGVLGQVFSPDEVANLGAIAADLQRSQRTLNATRLPGQSNTAQDWYKTQAKLAETHQSSLFSKLWKAGLAGGELGVTGAISSMVSTVGAHVAQSMRAAGLKNVDDIVREALLNPEFAKALLMKQSPAQIKNASQSTLAHIIARTIAYPELRRDDRAQRASGGRIQKRDYPAKRASLIEREAERVKKALGGELRPLMNEPDHIVASALRIANRDRG